MAKASLRQASLFDRPVRSFMDELEDDTQDQGDRYYQVECVNSVYAAFGGHTSLLVVMATGTGKSRVFSRVAKRWPGRVLVLAHRDELISQARKNLEDLTGEFVGTEQADLRSGRERIVVGSIQTVCRDHRLERLIELGGFTLVIIDEAHHAIAATYRKTIQTFLASGNCKLMGVTATPDRGDNKAMGQVFEHTAFTFDIETGIDAGYLVPLTGERVLVKSIDLSGVKTSAGDLNLKDLDEVMMKSVEAIAQETVRRWPDRCGPAFFPGKKSAQLACHRFNALKPNSAAVVTDDTDKEERRRIMADVKLGKIQYLCNCMVATEGFDWPDASIVIMGRPTKSRALYCQMVGRGTRVLAGLVEHIEGAQGGAVRRALIASSRKPDCLIADFVGNSGKHSLMSPEDILGGRYTDAEIKKAKAMSAKEPGSNVRENLIKARSELQALARGMASKIEAKAERFDPFKLLHIEDQDPTSPKFRGRDPNPATPGQIAGLVKWGVEEKLAKTLSKSEASKLMGTCAIRNEKGLASFKMLKRLSQHGITEINITRERASAAMNYLESIGWGKVSKADPEVLSRIIHKEKTNAQ